MSRLRTIARAGKAASNSFKNIGRMTKRSKVAVSTAKTNIKPSKPAKPTSFKEAKEKLSSNLEKKKLDNELAAQKRKDKYEASKERAKERATQKAQDHNTRLEMRKRKADAKMGFKEAELKSRASVRDKWRQNLEAERHARAMGRVERKRISAQGKADAKVAAAQAKADSASNGNNGSGVTVVGGNGGKDSFMNDIVKYGVVSSMLGGGGGSSSGPAPTQTEQAAPSASSGGNGQGGLNIIVNTSDNTSSQKENSWASYPTNSGSSLRPVQGSSGTILPGTNNGNSSAVIAKPGASATGNGFSMRLG